MEEQHIPGLPAEHAVQCGSAHKGLAHTGQQPTSAHQPESHRHSPVGRCCRDQLPHGQSPSQISRTRGIGVGPSCAGGVSTSTQTLQHAIKFKSCSFAVAHAREMITDPFAALETVAPSRTTVTQIMMGDCGYSIWISKCQPGHQSRLDTKRRHS